MAIKKSPPPLRSRLVDDGGLISPEWEGFFRGEALTSFGTHAQRPPARDVTDGTLYYETDRTVYYVAIAGVWKFFHGRMTGTITGPDLKPADLTAVDAGFLFWASDYFHLYEWSGSAWAYAAGDPGSGEIQWRMDAPETGLWQGCNGATVNRATSAGGVVSVTVPDLIDLFIKGAGSYSGTPVAPVIPTLSGATAASTDSTEVQAGTGATVAADAHTHGFGTLLISNDAEPECLQLIPYFRR